MEPEQVSAKGSRDLLAQRKGRVSGSRTPNASALWSCAASGPCWD